MKKYSNKKQNGSKGFTLVELIIVIAIIAILTGIMVPMLINYVWKARKSADIQTADAIASVFRTEMVSEPTLYNFVSSTVSAGQLNDTTKKYRVLAYTKSGNISNGQFKNELVVQNNGSSNTFGDTAELNEIMQGICEGQKYLQFYEFSACDTMVIAADKDMQIYVFIGYGSQATWNFTESEKPDKTNHPDAYKWGTGQVYMVYPTVCTDYMAARRPINLKKGN